MVGKNDGNRPSTDEEVLKVIEKFVKNANEIKDILLKNNKNASSVISEILVLSEYLPQKLSEHDLGIIVRRIIKILGDKSPKSMGKVMGVLKEKYGGRYDGKMASEIVKKELMG